MRRLLPPLVLLALTVSGCTGLQPAAAIVNGEKISEAALQEEVDRVRDDPSFQELLRQQGDRIRGIARRQVLTRFIRETLMDQQARERDIQVTDERIAEFVEELTAQVGGPERYQELLREANLTPDRVRVLAHRQIVQQELEKQLSAGLSVSDEQVRRWYDQNAQQLTQYHLLKIVVASEPDAQSIADQAGEGADFAALARDRSEDPSAAGGGDIGFVGEEQIGGALSSQMEAAGPGGVVGPIRGPSGFEVYKVLDVRQQPIEELRGQVTDQLLAGERRDVFERWAEQTLRAADVVVNPKYGRFDPSSLTVVGGPEPLPE